MHNIYKAMNLLENLNITKPIDIENALDVLAPSMAEYFIEESLSNILMSIRNSEIESVTVFGNYRIINKYNGDICIETKCTEMEETMNLFSKD